MGSDATVYAKCYSKTVPKALQILIRQLQYKYKESKKGGWRLQWRMLRILT